MCQSFIVVNIDKKEMLDAFDFGQSMELTKFAFQDNPLVIAMMNLIGRKWRGDRVYVIGENADKTPEIPWDETYLSLAKELGCNKDRGLQSWCFDSCTRLSPVKACPEELGWRYIYNHATKQFVDLEHCPPFRRGEAKHLAPLPLLLAMGNGKGRRDYYGANRHLVGSWCSTSDSIEIRKYQFPVEYSELLPNFSNDYMTIIL